MPVQMQSAEQLVPAGTWSVDRAHSSIEFRVRHLMLASVKGSFGARVQTVEGVSEVRRAWRLVDSELSVE
jgi:polyisoprenoid-binding protein YceI